MSENMEPRSKTTKQNLNIGFFSGYLALEESIDDRGEYNSRYYYVLRNTVSGHWCCGLHDSNRERVMEQITTRISEYYEDNPQEFQKFKESVENNNTK